MIRILLFGEGSEKFDFIREICYNLYSGRIYTLMCSVYKLNLEVRGRAIIRLRTARW